MNYDEVKDSSISDALEAIASLDNQKTLSEDGKDWLQDMYSDDKETLEFLRSVSEKKHTENLPKVINKQFIEFKDEKGNFIKVPSEKYVVSLEERLDRLEEVVRIQKSELVFLKNKYLISQQQLKNLESVLNYFNEV